jgi:hypothetical protein
MLRNYATLLTRAARDNLARIQSLVQEAATNGRGSLGMGELTETGARTSSMLDIERAEAGLEKMIEANRPTLDRLFAEVRGGVGGETLPLLFFLHQHQNHWRVRGNVAEIGILYGLYLICLSYLGADEERIVGLDVFDEQIFNIDKAGEGAEDIVRQNVARFAPRPNMFDLIKADSTSFHSAARFLDFVQKYREFKIFSIDGCHLKNHTIADISFGQSVLANGGLLIIDDFTNDGWTGVADGTATFFASRNIRLAPVLVAFNKLICTTISHQEIYFNALSEWTRTAGFSRRYGAAKPVPIYGYTAWHFNLFRGM